MNGKEDDRIDRPANPPDDRARFSDLEDEVSLRELAIVPLKRKKTVIACTLLGLLVAILIDVTMIPRYRATATIELNGGSRGQVSALSDLASAAAGGADDLKVMAETEIAVIKDESIALTVMRKMGMLHPGKPGPPGKGEDSTANPPGLTAKQREGLVGGFESNLEVAQVKNSRLIAITYSSKDPVEAANIANEVVAAYKSYLLSSNYDSSNEVSQWLAAQLNGLSDRVGKSEQAVAEFERTHNLSASMLGMISLGGGSGGASGGGASIQELSRLSALNEEVTQAEAARLQAEAVYRMTATQNPDLIASIGSNPTSGFSNSSVVTQGSGLELLNGLRAQEATSKVAYAETATKYGLKNPRLIEIQNQLKSIQEQIQSEMEKIRQRAKNDLTLAQEHEQALKSAYGSQQVVTSKLNDDILHLGILLEEQRSSRDLYNILYARLQETNIDSGSSATNVTLADPARPPGTPYTPRRGSFLRNGFLGGLFLGIALAYLLESQADTLTDSFEVESLTHVPVLGMIPFFKRDEKISRESASPTEQSPFLGDPKGATAEALRSLRSGLILSGVGRRLKLLAVTSALGSEGKSFTVYNLGLAFAATGMKVLIIDADLRRPSQSLLFRLPRKDGLSSLLAGIGSFDDVVQPHSLSPNLFLLSAGQTTPLASELLESGEIEKILHTAREKFDLVLVDNAPVLPVADPIQIAIHCDRTIGVLRSGRTSRKAVRRFVQILARNRIHLLGIVIEAVDMSASEYRSVYGYNVENYYGER